MFMYDYVIVSQSTMSGISLKWRLMSISIDELMVVDEYIYSFTAVSKCINNYWFHS